MSISSRYRLLNSKFQHLYITWVTFAFEKTFTKILSEIASQKNWDDMFTTEINSRINTESKRITFWEIWTLTSFLVFSIESWPVLNLSGNIIGGFGLLENILGPVSKIVISAIYLTFPVVGYTGFIGGGLIIYTIYIIKFYVYCISHRLKELSEKNLCEYDDKDEYQIEIFTNQKTCIQCHQLVQM
mgnify:FL=1